MNSAVGGMGIPWKCIESMEYEKMIRPVAIPEAIARHCRKKEMVPVIVRAPDGVITEYHSVNAACKAIKLDHKHANIRIRAVGHYETRSGYILVAKELD